MNQCGVSKRNGGPGAPSPSALNREFVAEAWAQWSTDEDATLWKNTVGDGVSDAAR
jgi:hypothetical protein